MDDAPVTVLMAVRNGGRWLAAAIDSILAQTFERFRFLIIDDASTDGTPELVRGYRDPRIELVALDRNVGQTAALNLGLRRARSPWIARMDADDYSAPDRLEQQMRALEDDPRLACVGTGAWEFREDPHRADAAVSRPERHEDIVRALLVGAAMIHGTILANRQALLDVGAYDERFRYAADRDLFVRLFASHRGRNLATPLLGIRRSPRQDSFSERAASEYIQIFAEMLASGRYAAQERAVLRASLAYAHVFRARCRLGTGRATASLRDLAQAGGMVAANAFKRSVGSYE